MITPCGSGTRGAGDLITVLRGHRDAVRYPGYTADGSRLISSSSDGTLRVWDMDLAERNGGLRGHKSFVYDVAFRPDGEQVASAAWDGTVRLWDPDTGRQTGLLRSDSEIMSAVAYSPDGGRLATANRALGVALWNARHGQTRAHLAGRNRPLEGRRPGRVQPRRGARRRRERGGARASLGRGDRGPGLPSSPATKGAPATWRLPPTARSLASAGLDGTIRLWDVATRQSRGRPPRAYGQGHPHRLQRRRQADRIGLRRLHRPPLGQPGARSPLPPSTSAAWSTGSPSAPTARDWLSVAPTTTIRLIDVATRQEVAELHGHTDFVHAVAWSPDGTRLVSGSGDLTVRVWDSLSIEARARAGQRKPTH